MAGGVLEELFVILKLKDEFSENLDKTTAKFEGIGSKMSSIGAGLTVGVTAPIAGAVGTFALAGDAAANFESKMGEVFTLMPGISKEAMDKMGEDV